MQHIKARFFAFNDCAIIWIRVLRSSNEELLKVTAFIRSLFKEKVFGGVSLNEVQLSVTAVSANDPALLS